VLIFVVPSNVIAIVDLILAGRPVSLFPLAGKGDQHGVDLA
jgi:hypothetical protein